MLELNSNSKILITGIKGFVGSNLNEYLKGKFEIVGVSRERRENVISYEDLNNDILNSCETFIHLAGKAHDLKGASDHDEYFEANTKLTKILFDKFLKSDCETFIFMSSVKAVADKLTNELYEEFVPNPITVYGKSKLKAEEYILSKKLPNSKRVYILRPCMIHGAGNKGNLNLLYNFVSNGMPYPFGKYENKRSFLSIDNLCFTIKELIERKEVESGVYNISDDESLSTKELVEILGKCIDKKVMIFNLPKFIVFLIAKIGDVISIPINSEKLQKLTENYVVSNKKIKEVLEINVFPLDVRKGIIKTIKSFN